MFVTITTLWENGLKRLNTFRTDGHGLGSCHETYQLEVPCKMTAMNCNVYSWARSAVPRITC